MNLSYTAETQRSRAATKLFLKYAEGVGKFQPRVGAGDNPGKQGLAKIKETLKVFGNCRTPSELKRIVG